MGSWIVGACAKYIHLWNPYKRNCYRPKRECLFPIHVCVPNKPCKLWWNGIAVDETNMYISQMFMETKVLMVSYELHMLWRKLHCVGELFWQSTRVRALKRLCVLAVQTHSLHMSHSTRAWSASSNPTLLVKVLIVCQRVPFQWKKSSCPENVVDIATNPRPLHFHPSHKHVIFQSSTTIAQISMFGYTV